MAGNIKGLHIKIGGDATELGKALEKVDSKAKMLSSELGAINRLLKVDPGNYDALAQKQKILADAVQNTREKLDTLKEAERQVQAQFERGEVSEEQVSALRNEIVNTTAKLKSYEKAAQETADAMEQLGKSDADEAIEETGDEAKAASKKVEELADASDKAEKAGGGMGATLGNIAVAGLKAVGAAVGAAVTGLVAAAEASREYRADMGKLDTAFTTAGHSAEAAYTTYAELQGILGESDQAVEAANHLAQLTTNEQELATWTNIATGVYATFGDSLPIENLTEAANETAKTGAITGGLADALNWAGVSEDEFQAKLDACTTEQERQALITETLNGLYSEAADQYRETSAEVIRANQANEAWTRSMAEIGGAIEPVISSVKLIGASLLSELVPGVTSLSDALQALLDGQAGAADQVGAALSGIITHVLNLATELLPTVADIALSLVTTLTTSLISALPQLLAIGIEIIGTLTSGIISALPQLIAAIVDAIPGLVSALTVQLPAAIMQIVDALVQNLPLLISGLVQMVTGLVQAAPTIMQALLPMIPQIITGVCTAIAESLPVLLTATVELIWQLATQIIPEATRMIWEIIPQIIVALVDGLAQIWDALNSWCLEAEGNIGAWLSGIGSSIGAWLSEVWSEFTTWLSDLISEASAAGAQFLSAVVSFMSQLPGKIWTWLQQAITKVTTWASNIVSNARTAASNFLSNVTSFFSQLPGKIGSYLSSVISNVVSWGGNIVSNARSAVSNLVSTVVSTISSLPGQFTSIGRNIIQGLINGITGMVSSLYSSIRNALSGLVDRAKNALGIHSPSKVFADEIGANIPEGVAQGIEAHMGSPVAAITHVNEEMLDAATKNVDGIQLERSLMVNHGLKAASAGAEIGGLSMKLDKILTAIERGQVLMLDGDALVGGTVDRYDAAMGQRRLLAARGAV